ncbi:hypothetical protein PluTT01m_13705 [Photorhabdus laumondii subsp. laumondii]|nr:hypothetical protein PluTT01m_13705 [Photorhabdus laumondii subsp. laumondii]
MFNKLYFMWHFICTLFEGELLFFNKLPNFPVLMLIVVDDFSLSYGIKCQSKVLIQKIRMK